MLNLSRSCKQQQLSIKKKLKTQIKTLHLSVEFKSDF